MMRWIAALALTLPQETPTSEDFELPQNLNLVYDGWERVRSDEHPAYNRIAVVRDRAKSGSHFLRMTTLGRRTSFRMSRGWEIDPERSHRATAWVRLAARRNTASIALVWLDRDRQPLREDRSAPLAAAGDWTEIAVDVPSIPAAARRVALRLDFEGPDYEGLCDFDLLRLESSPRLLLRRPPPAAEGGPAALQLEIAVSGLPPGPHPLRLRLLDSEGREIAVDRNAAFTTPVLPPGVYELQASVGDLARRAWPLLVPAPFTSAPSLRRPFGGRRADALAGFQDGATGPALSIPFEDLPRFLRRLVAAAAEGPALLPMEDLVDAEGYPRAALLAVRSVNDALAGAVPRKDLSLSDPRLRDAVFERGGRLVVAAWSESGPVEREIALGPDVETRPALGVPQRLEKVVFGPQPTFLSGVEPSLLRIHQEFRLPDTLPLGLDPATRVIRLRNPFRDEALADFRVRFQGPVRPAELRAESLGPDQEFAQEVSFTLPADQEEGDVPIRTEISFTRGGTTFLTRIDRTLRVAPQIAIAPEVTALPDRAKKVAIRITNAAPRPLNLVARVRLPGQPETNAALGLVPAGAERALEFEVRDAHLLDPTAAGECRVEEQGGGRLHARKIIPLR